MNNNYSISLDGSTQYLSVSDADQIGLKMSAGFSMMMWVRFASLPSPTSFAVAGKSDQNTGSDYGYITFIHNNMGTLRFLTYLASASSVGNSYAQNWTPVIDTWYHIA